VRDSMGIRRPWLSLYCLFASLFILVPVFVMVVISLSSSRYLEFPPPGISLRWYKALIDDQSWGSSLRRSLVIAGEVTIISVVLGVSASHGLVALKGRWLRVALLVAICPILVPAIVMAVAAQIFYSSLGLAETSLAIALAHVVLALPFVIVTMTASMLGLDPNLHWAAQTLGLRPVEVFFRTTLPLLRPALFLSAFLAFVTSFDEPVIAQFVAGTVVVTLPKRMWDGIQYEIDPSVAAMSSIIVIGTCVIFLLVRLALRGWGRVSRVEVVTSGKGDA
jgi:putative spermidine/putrescine transport system permease protein